MNSTVGRGEWVAAEALSVLPAQLTSLPALAAAVAVIAACVWFSSGADDFGRLPGPPSDSWLLGSMKKVGMRREAQLRTATPSEECLVQRLIPAPSRPPPLFPLKLTVGLAHAGLPFPSPSPHVPSSWPSEMQVNQPRVHRFFQENTQLYGAGGRWGFRLAYLRVVVLSSPETVQAVASRGTDLPKVMEMGRKCS